MARPASSNASQVPDAVASCWMSTGRAERSPRPDWKYHSSAARTVATCWGLRVTAGDPAYGELGARRLMAELPSMGLAAAQAAARTASRITSATIAGPAARPRNPSVRSGQRASQYATTAAMTAAKQVGREARSIGRA